MTMLYKNISVNDGSWKFRTDDFDLNDAPRSRRPTEVDDDKIKALIDSNLRYTRDCRNIEHPSFKHLRLPEEAGIRKQAKIFGFFINSKKSLFDGAYKHLRYAH